MFKNPGRQIKSIVSFITFLMFIAGIAIGYFLYDETGSPVFLILGAGAALVGAWLWGLMLYAFGELVESAETSRKYINELGKMLKDDLGALKSYEYNNYQQLANIEKELSYIVSIYNNQNGQP